MRPEEPDRPTSGHALDAPTAEAIVRDAARDYFASRRAAIGPFVDRHFTFTGSAAIHRRAFGWDLIRAPVNVLLAIPNVGIRLAALGAGAVGARRAASFLGSRRVLLDTAVGREIQWLIVTELLELPLRLGDRESRRDALAETICAMPQVQDVMRAALEAVGHRRDDPAFRRKLEDALADYAGTRAAAAEITTAFVTLGAGALAVNQATPGMISLGPLLAAAIAQQMAIASFPLGAAVGGVWYGVFPAAASPMLMAGVTGGLMLVGAAATSFSGLVADPLQRRIGLHQRRLHRLTDTLERQFYECDESGFVARDHYVARLIDLFDMLGGAVRLARG